MKHTFIVFTVFVGFFLGQVSASEPAQELNQAFDVNWKRGDYSGIRYPHGEMKEIFDACVPSSSVEVKQIYETLHSSERLLAGYIPRATWGERIQWVFIACSKIEFEIMEDGAPVKPNVIHSWRTDENRFPGGLIRATRNNSNYKNSDPKSWMLKEFKFSPGKRRRGLLILYGFGEEIEDVRAVHDERRTGLPRWTVDGTVDTSYRPIK